MVSVTDGVVTDRFRSLIKPPPNVGYFSPFNVAIHGITSEMVHDAPEWRSVLAEILEFADGNPLVAHNAAFDIGVLRDACSESGIPWPDVTYACTLVLARRTWRLISYSLPWVVEAAGGSLSDHHDPLADATGAAEIVTSLLREHELGSLESLLSALNVAFGRVTAEGEWRGCHMRGITRRMVPDANADADPDGPLYGLRVCFTGALLAMTRAEAHALLAEVGGQPMPGVTRHTDLLVVGTQDPGRLRPGSLVSEKQRKAQHLLDEGREIEVVSEADFLQLLASSESANGLRPIAVAAAG